MLMQYFYVRDQLRCTSNLEDNCPFAAAAGEKGE
jgi:hypothetical protein